MNNRKYFNTSIKDLEEIFKNESDNSSQNNTILSELGFRSTQRSQKLKTKIKKFIESTVKVKTKTDELIQIRLEESFIEPERMKPVVKEYVRMKKPDITNQPQNILHAWTALEVLSPRTFRRKSDFATGPNKQIVLISDSKLPWVKGEKSRKNKKLVYEIILGSISLSPAYEALLNVFSDNRPDQRTNNGYAAIASIIVDKTGRPIDDEACYAISSFAWGFPKALTGDLLSLADWTSCEAKIKHNLKKKLIRRDDDGDILPLTKTSIQSLFKFLVNELDLGGQKILAPDFLVRRFEFFASKIPPEPSLLNSFFLEDLSLAGVKMKNGSAPRSLKLFLGQEEPNSKTDLLDDEEGLVHILRPEATPLGRWPAKGRFPLALLQQAAINGVNDHLKDNGILSVNGPPGTGKTTLLRDVVAARLIERAEKMITFKDPSMAFKASSQSVQRNKAKITFHHLSNSLKGFEMVVASSNNKAVENVSAELPDLSAIAEDAPNLRYFSSISDHVLKSKTWGMIAAVLGNSNNRYEFSQAFWKDEENGLATYLKQAAGDPQFIMEKQSDGTLRKRIPSVIQKETPPNTKKEAIDNWGKSCSAFASAKLKAQETRNQLQFVHSKLVSISELLTNIESAKSNSIMLKEKISQLSKEITDSEKEKKLLFSKLQKMETQCTYHMRLTPNFIVRIFNLRAYREWKIQKQHNDFERDSARAEYITAKEKNEKHCLDHAKLEQEYKSNELLLGSLSKNYAESIEIIKAAKKNSTAPIPDNDFFNGSPESIQMAHLWFNEADSLERDNVFEAAIAIHKSFIDCAAEEIQENLAIFIETFGTRSFGTTAKDKMIPELWATFFLVVPVISTTFASVNSMFSRLPQESLGWLLIDEAGQAVPQAAVGAIMRTKRSIVVGDPLQIEPVVTLPNTLTEEICGYFGIDAEQFNAPQASVQTLADKASPHSARFRSGSGYRDVGSPLLVHRRCDSPMFDISNSIAYANLMVQAKAPPKEKPVLGDSRWIDVVGEAGPDKWCQSEGEVLLENLRNLRQSGANADLYIITPFVIVQDNLRKMLQADGVLNGWVDNPSNWVFDHVGTVHTVQGREAETVFFVLGAQANNQFGARSWAGRNPNLPNVAVTRAKSALYVIGNRVLWKNAGYFETLDRLMI